MPRDMDNYRRYQAAYREQRRYQRPEKLMSFDEIGRRLGISGEYARMIYRQAVKKIKAEMEAK